ncbi:Holo-[acyl-carrier-protein] synthase [Chlamydiales bacterium STE3]|nr:Holo-[acyl-carrier-protein] synthase [Chlamydiales bacterium STE3]
MIINIGNDIIEISRIKANLEKYGQKFLDRIFLPEEQAYCLKFQDPSARLAGRFAAKEAVAKALGTGFSKELSFLDISIQNGPRGNPLVLLSSAVMEHFGNPNILISISHCKEYATAVALLMD